MVSSGLSLGALVLPNLVVSPPTTRGDISPAWARVRMEQHEAAQQSGSGSVTTQVHPNCSPNPHLTMGPVLQ